MPKTMKIKFEEPELYFGNGKQHGKEAKPGNLAWGGSLHGMETGRRRAGA